MPLIGLSGAMGCGKDTVASMIKNATPHLDWHQYAYATKLREALALLTGIPAAETVSAEDKARFHPEWGMTTGKMLQILGTDAIRNNFHPQTWIFALFGPRGQWQRDGKPPAIVTDVRFPNEAEIIRECGGIVINIVRPPKDGGSFRDDGRDKKHPSETSLADVKFDATIANTGTLEDLANEVKRVLEGE